jgi:phosphatidylinositol-3-phosphatase
MTLHMPRHALGEKRARTRLALGVLALLVLIILAGLALRPLAEAVEDQKPSSLPLVKQPCGSSTTAVPHYQHVIWIWMENHSYHQVMGSESAPYENALAAACGLATNYHAIAHPSLPNYLAATAGSTFGIARDRWPSAQPINAPSIFSEVARSGRQWRTYVESMPANCRAMGRHGYARNPPIYFAGSRGRCTSWDVSMGTAHAGALATALRTNQLPAFSLIIPSRCHSTHDCPVASGDAWLSRWINHIVASPSYRNGSTAIFLTWDEGKHDLGQHVPLIVVSPSTTPGTVSRTRFDHYSLLRATAGLLDVRPPGNASTAPSLRLAFGL